MLMDRDALRDEVRDLARALLVAMDADAEGETRRLAGNIRARLSDYWGGCGESPARALRKVSPLLWPCLESLLYAIGTGTDRRPHAADLRRILNRHEARRRRHLVAVPSGEARP